MKLNVFIRALQHFEKENPEIPVCISDWGEQYRNPDEDEAEELEVVDGCYVTSFHNRALRWGERKSGLFLQIGS